MYCFLVNLYLTTFRHFQSREKTYNKDACGAPDKEPDLPTHSVTCPDNCRRVQLDRASFNLTGNNLQLKDQPVVQFLSSLHIIRLDG